MRIIIAVSLLTLVLIGYFLIRPKEPTYNGKNMSEWLALLGTHSNRVDHALRIVKTDTDKKLGTVDFEVPMSYDALQQNDFLNGGSGGKFNLILNERNFSIACLRATNGNTILRCYANEFAPGTNRIQVAFFIFNRSDPRSLSATSPVEEIVSSNICRVDEKVWMDHSKGLAILWADLSISNASYRIELLDTNGSYIKSISGITSNGTINESWNLIGDSGKRYALDSFDAVFHVFHTNSVQAPNE